MLKQLTVVLAAVPLLAGLAGCADNSDEAKQAVERLLTVGYQVEYGELVNYPGGVVCGQYSAIGRFGVKEGLSTFIYRDGVANLAPSEEDLAIFCSDDPAAVFKGRFGVDPLAAGNTTLAAIHRDMQTLDQALQQYLLDNKIYPLTAQGLEALVVASQTGPRPVRFREGGYLDKVPMDPWGRPYQYRSEEVLRMEPIVYTLNTLGRDGAPGGSGEDADISSSQLKYLDHLAKL